MSVTPSGGEQLVNTTTSDFQQNADVAVAPDGSSVAVWQSANQDGSGWGIFGRRMDPSGNATTAEFQVNAAGVGDQVNPAVAVDGSGNFVVTWESGGDIYFRLFDSASNPLTNDTAANDSPAGTQADPDVAMNAAGSFIIAWDGQLPGDTAGVAARRFDATGAALGTSFALNTTQSGIQNKPAVAITTGGAGVAVWTDASNPLSEIRGQRFDSSGALAGGEFVVYANAAIEDDASVGMDGGGNFAIAFERNLGGGSSQDIFVRRYDASGSPLAAPFVANTTTSQPQINPSLAMSTNTGAFAVTWDSNNQDGSQFGIFGQAFTPAGAPDGSEYQVNTTTGGSQKTSSTAWGGSRVVTAWDGNGTGDADGVFVQPYATLNPNQPPVNTVPAAQTTAEDTSLIFSSGNGNAISVADPDAGSGAVKVTLTVSGGRLTLSMTSGLSFITGDGAADATMTFTGTLSAINAALNGLNFTPTADANGAVTLTITSDDQGNTGSGGALTDADTVTINVTAVNDAPVNLLPASQSATGGSILNLGSSYGNPISVTDVDAGSGSLRVTLTASAGTLTLGSKSGLSFTTGDGTADSTTTFQGTLANINAALDTLSYSPPLLMLGNATITITTNDLGNSGAGGAQSDTDALSVGVTPHANVAPVNTVPAVQSVAEDSNLIFSTTNGNGISINDADAFGGDMKVTLTASNGTLSLSNLANLTFISGTGSGDGSMTFTGTLADINNALDGMVFTPAADFNGAASVQIVTNDQGNTGTGGALSDTDTVSVNVSAVNDAPTNSMPADQATNVNVPLVLSSANGNVISVDDIDAGSGKLLITLTASHGTLTLATLSGLTFTAGDGTADATMSFKGTIAAVNAALDGMTFTPTAAFIGVGSIQITTNDQGNTGTGGALSATSSIAVEMVTEFRANTTISDTQIAPAVAVDRMGNFVVVWASHNQDGGGYGVYAQRFDANHNPIGSEFRVNTFTSGDQNKPQVAMDANGDFVVTWASNNEDGNGWGVYARRYNASGVAITGELLVNTTTSGNQDTPWLAMAGDGSFVIVWKSDRGGTGTDIYAQRFDSSGAALGSEFRVNTNLTDSQDQPTVAVDTSGNFVVAWRSNKQDLSNAGVFARRYDAAGNPLTGEFQVNVNNSGSQDKPTIAISASGFVIAWSSGNNQDGDKHGIFARRFNTSGNPIGGEFLVNTRTTDEQDYPAIGMAADGSFTIAWSSNNQDGNSLGIYAQNFDASGTRVGGEYRVNGTTSGSQAQPAVGVGAYGDLAIVWQGPGVGDTSGVFGQSWAHPNAAPAVTVPTTQSVNEDTNLVFSTASGNAISVDDADAGSAAVRFTLTAINGMLTLASTAGITFITGDGTSDATMSVTGTLASINAALNGLIFRGSLNFNGAANLQVTINDQGNSGTGGALSDAQSVSINVAAVNDAPILSGSNAMASIAEDATSNAGTLVSDLISGTVSDADAGALGGIAVVAVDHSNGAWQYSTDGGSNWTNFGLPSPVAARLLAADGSMRVRFVPNPDFNGTIGAGITFRAWDQTGGLAGGTADVSSNGGASAFSAVTASASIAVTAVNDPPIITVPGAQSISEDASVTFSTANGSAFSIVDVDAGSGQVRLTLTASGGVMTLASTAGLTFTTGDGSADATIVFTGTLANINAALAGLVFQPAANFNGAASIAVSANDQGNSGAGGALSDSQNISINVAAVNDAPVLSGANDLAAISEDATSNSGSLVSALLSGHDTDVDTGAAPGIAVTAVDDGNGTWQYSTDGGANWNSFGACSTTAARLLAADASTRVRFVPGPNFNGIVNGGLTFRAWDQTAGAASGVADVSTSGGTSAFSASSASAGINVTAVNDAPAISVPVTQSINEDGSIVFSTANGDAISIADVDASGGLMRLTIVALDGTLTLASTAGLTFTTGDGTSDSTIAFTGTLSAINAALDGLTFTASPDFNGFASIGMTVGDNGNSGAGGELTDTQGVAIAVNAINDPPTVIASATGSILEDRTLTFDSAGGNSITVSDIDAGSTDLLISLTASHGTLTLATTSGLTFVTGDGADDATISFTGTLSDINAALDGLTFAPSADFNGGVTINIHVDDQGHSGAGGSLSDGAAIAVGVTAVNDPPVLTIDSATLNYLENDPPLAIASGLDLHDVDDATLAGATVAIQNYVPGEDVLCFTSVAGISGVYDASTGTLTFTGNASVAAYQSVLRSVKYQNTSDTPDETTRQLSISVSDGVDTVAVTRDIAVTAANDPPRISPPPAQTIDEDTPLVFTSLGGNAITLSDLDAGADVVRLSLTVSHGTISLASTSGLTLLSGDGTEDAAITVEGTLASINAALDGLMFSPAADFYGTAALRLVTNDLGHDGGAAQADDRTLSIVVSPVNDAPTATSLPDVNSVEDDPTLAVDLAAHFHDVEDASLHFSVVGNTNASLFESLTVDQDTGRLTLSYAPNAYGAASVTIGGTDSGGLFVELTLNINVAAVNDAPVLATDATLQILPAASAVLSRNLLRATDVDNDPAELTFTLTRVPQYGDILLDGAALGVGDQFTQADIDSGRISFTSITSKAEDDGCAFRISDGSGGMVDRTQFLIRIRPLMPEGGTGPVTPPDSGIQTPDVPQQNDGDTDVSTTPSPDRDSKQPIMSLPAPFVTHHSSGGSGASSGPVGGGGGATGDAAADPAPAPTPAPKPAPDGPKLPEPAPAPAPATPRLADAAPAPVAPAPRETSNSKSSVAVAPAAPPPSPAAATPSAATASEQLAFVAQPESTFAKVLDHMHDQVTQETSVLKLVAGTASFVSLGFSIVYILWTIRAGYFLASVLSSMPAWQFVDPLPILENGRLFSRRKQDGDEDGESLESLVSHGGTAADGEIP